MQYAIGDFSELTGLSAHTLRYYEKEGLLSPDRDSAGRRRYSHWDADWAAFIIRLKDTGMPLREIKRYASLREAGDETLCQRLELLERHQERLSERLRQLEEHRNKLDEKISFYQTRIAEASAAHFHPKPNP